MAAGRERGYVTWYYRRTRTLLPPEFFVLRYCLRLTEPARTKLSLLVYVSMIMLGAKWDGDGDRYCVDVVVVGAFLGGGGGNDAVGNRTIDKSPA